MRSLVTGAGGFVGRHLLRHLEESGDEVLACDIVTPSDLDAQFEQLDVSDADAVGKILARYKPEVIYHLAGMAFVPDAESNFDAALKANVLGTSIVCRLAHLLDIPSKVVFISSAEVYGKVAQEGLPITESTSLRPMNNYSLSKAMAELVVQRYERTGTPRGVILRPFNHIGPGQSPKFVASAFAYQLAQIAKKKAPPIVEVGNLEAQRDFSDVRDIVRAYRLAALRGDGVYNLCAGQAFSIQLLLNELIAISGQQVRVVQNPQRMRGPEVPVLYGSCEKASRELGWKPSIKFRATLQDVFDYWMARS